MQQGKPTIKKGRREVKEIVDTCRAVEERRFNPFFIDIRESLETLNRYYPIWRGLQDHSMDAAALKSLSKVLALQNSQLLYQSSRLYADPEMIASRLRRLTTVKLAEALLGSFHPLIAMEQLTTPTLCEALSHWSNMEPYAWRSRKIMLGERPKSLSSDALEAMGIAERRRFNDKIREMEQQLEDATREGPVDYQAFIQKKDYRETVERAYLVSFLLTYGRASIIEDEDGHLWMIHGEGKGEAESLPIQVKCETEG